MRGCARRLVALERCFRRRPRLTLRRIRASTCVQGCLRGLKCRVIPVRPAKLVTRLPSLEGERGLIMLETRVSTLPVRRRAGLPCTSMGRKYVRTYNRSVVLTTTLVLTGVITRRREVRRDFPIELQFLFRPTRRVNRNTGEVLRTKTLRGPGTSTFLVFRCTTSVAFKVTIRRKRTSSVVGDVRVRIRKGSDR